MILGASKELFLMFSGLVFLSSILVYLVLVIFKFKSIIGAFKKIPIWFVLINLGILAYKLFVIPSVVFRNNFGVWILSMAKSETIWTVLLNQRAPVYFFIIKISSILLDGVSFVFVSNFNITLSFFVSFFVYYIVYVLLKDKLLACVAALFYTITPIIFIYSMTEGYTNPALFFAIQALFFIALYINKKDYSFLILGIASSYLAVGSRPEYIIFDLIFLVFIYLFVKKIKLKHYLIYLILFLPKFFIALNMYLENIVNDEFLIGKTFVYRNLPDFIYNILNYRLYSFFNNLYDNFIILINPFSLMGILMLFALFFIFRWRTANSKWKKVYLFFIFYYLVFFLYYLFLHRDGITGNYKYISSLVLPMVILGAMGLRVFLGAKYKIGYYFILFVFIFYSLWVGSPFTYGMYSKIDPRFSEGAMGRYFRLNKVVIKEWNTYQSLVVENRYSNLTKDKESDINLNDKNIFVINGHMSFLYAIAINSEIYTVTSLRNLNSSLNKIRKDEVVYIYQGIIGFGKEGDYNITDYRAIDPVEFEKYITKALLLEKVIVSYYEDDHHVFLYRMRKK